MAKAALTKQENYAPEEVKPKLEKILSDSGILELVSGKKILVKPNCTGLYSPEEGRTTHPVVVKCLVELLQSAGTLIKIGESSSVGIDTSVAYQMTGVSKIAEELSIELIDFKKSRYREIEINSGLALDKINLPEEIFSVDYLFSLAKLKTNFVSGISCAIKNLKGLLPDLDKKKFHRLGIAPALADLIGCFSKNQNLPGTLGLVDGILGSELYEPIKGNVLIASQNLFALDCLCAKVMGIEPYSVEHLRLADGEHLTTNLEIAGGSISSFSRKFKSQPPGLTSLEEEYSVKIKNGQACSSCLGALYLSLRKAKAQKPELLFGKEIVIGSYAGEVSSRTLFFGNCAVKKNRGNGTAIPGCVPSTSDFMEGLSQWGNYYQKLEKNI